MADQYRSKREALKKEGDYLSLQKLPRNSCRTRIRNRCFVTGRSRGYIGAFGVSRDCATRGGIERQSSRSNKIIMVAPLISDPIADFIIRLKNAYMAGYVEISVPYSAIKEHIAHKLVEKEYIKNVEIKGEGVTKRIVITLSEMKKNKKPIQDVKRVSKLGRRLYTKAKDVRPYKNGYGVTLLSTPKGVLFDYEARKHNVGGEVLFHIW